jgi:adenine-specific DNA-methyltransferase
MPTLNSIGKQAVVNHHTRVPCRLIQGDKSRIARDPDARKLHTRGDNLEALQPLTQREGACVSTD